MSKVKTPDQNLLDARIKRLDSLGIGLTFTTNGVYDGDYWLATNEEIMEMSSHHYDQFVDGLLEYQSRKESRLKRQAKIKLEKENYLTYLNTCFNFSETLGYDQPEVANLVTEYNERHKALVDDIINKLLQL